MKKSILSILLLSLISVLIVSFKSDKLFGISLPSESNNQEQQKSNLLSAEDRPNILIIITDQQRNDDMSCAGNIYVKTPSIDALAARGVRFTNSYCTSPLCVPSRASLATSRMPYEVMKEAATFRHIPTNMPSLGPLLREAGYRTAWSGKWHVRAAYPKKEENGGDLPGFEVLANKLLPSEALGKPERSISVESYRSYLIPPMKIRDFTFTSLSDAV